MCYHKIFVYLGCGHSVASALPVKSAPPCPSLTKELFSASNRASSTEEFPPSAWELEVAMQKSITEASVCTSKMSHPMHTFRVEGPCSQCRHERDQRLAQYEVRAIRNEVERRLPLEHTKDDTLPIMDFRVTSPGQKFSRRISLRKKIVAGAMDVAGWLSPTKPTFDQEALSPEHFALPRQDSMHSYDTETTSMGTSSD